MRNNGQNPTHRLVLGGGILFIVLKRRTLLLSGLALIIFLGGAMLRSSRVMLPVFSATQRTDAPVYVIDAGHGGEDGGAVSLSGVKESDINLAISKNLDSLLRFLGQKTLMTRSDDVSIHAQDAQTLRQKKASDLKNRAALVNATPCAILLSIHQNSLPSVPSVHGAQVFFGTAEQSAVLALSVQSALNESVNVGNEKHEKAIDPSIFLMKHVTSPAILIECGFLSNTGEAARLTAPEHQKTLAVSIAAGVLNADTKGREAP